MNECLTVIHNYFFNVVENLYLFIFLINFILLLAFYKFLESLKLVFIRLTDKICD